MAILKKKKAEPVDPNRKRRVMIGTPVLDGKFDAYYVKGVLDTVREAAGQGVEIMEWWQLYDSNLARARDRIIKQAMESDVDDLIFVDADIGFSPQNIWHLLTRPAEMVCGTYLRKDGSGVYEFKALDRKTQIDPESGMIEIEGAGLGFMRLSRKCFSSLYAVGTPYKDGEESGRSVFEFTIDRGARVSEDINLCRKWRRMGGKLFLDAVVTVRHTGMTSYLGDFSRDFPRVGFSLAPAKPQPVPVTK